MLKEMRLRQKKIIQEDDVESFQKIGHDQETKEEIPEAETVSDPVISAIDIGTGIDHCTKYQ